MNGYWKKLCRVNLTDRTWTAEDIDEKNLELLMGGTALGAKILLEETPAKVDPLSPENKIVFAIGACLITVLIRFWGGYPEGVSFAILLMNILSPYIEKLCTKKPFGKVGK